MSSPHKALKIAKITRCLQQELTTAERTLARETPQATQACNPSPTKQRVEETGYYRRTNGRKRTFRSCRTNSHRPYVDAESDIGEIGKGRKDLIPQYHCRHHLVDIARELNLE